MKRTRLFSVLHLTVWLILASGSSALAQTAAEMLHSCELLQRGMHVERNSAYLPPSNKANQCWGFVGAVLQYSMLADQSGKTLLGSCPGPDATVVQVTDAFVKYAQSHPEKADLSAAAAAYNAMADAFPCK